MEAIKIENVEEALKLFEDAAIKQSDASNNGKSKIANRNYDKIVSSISYLKNNDSLKELTRFYEHSNVFVRIWAASYLLPLYERKSLKILKEIADRNVLGSLEAEMTIKEWKNGNLKTFYTL